MAKELTKEDEIWKPIIGFEGLYEISNYGNVKALYKERPMPQNKGIKKYPEIILKTCKNNRGYLYITLVNLDIKIKFTNHRLVALHFIPNPLNLPEVMHLDDNPENNYYLNLQWGTHKNNMDLKVKADRQTKGENVKMSKLKNSDIIEIRKSYNKKSLNQYRLAEKYNVSQSVIHDILKYKSWKHIN